MTTKIAFAALLALAMPALPAVAQDRLNTDIVSPVPEGQEDCEALREKLEAQRDDNRLNSQDLQELDSKGC